MLPIDLWRLALLYLCGINGSGRCSGDTCRLFIQDGFVQVGAGCVRPLSHCHVDGVCWSGFTGPGLMLVGHGRTRIVCCGVLFCLKLIEGVEIGVIPMLLLVIHLLEAADDATFKFSLSTSLNGYGGLGIAPSPGWSRLVVKFTV